MSNKRTITRPTTTRKGNPPKLATAPADVTTAAPSPLTTEARRELDARAGNARRLAREIRVLARRNVVLAMAHIHGGLTAEDLEVSASLDEVAAASLAAALDDEAGRLEARYKAVEQVVRS